MCVANDSPGAVLDVEPLIEALQLALASGEEAREHVTIYVSEATTSASAICSKDCASSPRVCS